LRPSKTARLYNECTEVEKGRLGFSTKGAKNIMALVVDIFGKEKFSESTKGGTLGISRKNKEQKYSRQ
jgi:hypothetical protein